MDLYLDLSLCSLLLYSMTTWTGLGKIVPPNDIVVPTRFGANESSLLVVWASSSSCHGHETKDQKKTTTKTKHKGKKQEDETTKLTSPTTKTIGRKTADDPHHQHYLRLLWMPLLIVRSFFFPVRTT